MNKQPKLPPLSLVSLLFLMVACSENTLPPNAQDNVNVSGVASPVHESLITANASSGTPEGDTQNTQTNAEDEVDNANFTTLVKIQLAGTSATITNPRAGQGVDITQANGTVTVRSTLSEVAYEVEGTLTNGALKIYSDQKFKLTLKDAQITSSQGPALNIQSGKTAFIVLEGSNKLADAADYSNTPSDEDAKGTVFSEGPLVFSGTGGLEVAGTYSHGIVSDDYIRFKEGNITVSQAVKDAIHANDHLIVDQGTFNLAAQSDGIDAEKGFIVINNGTFNLKVVDDGIVASYDLEDETEPDASITPYVTINGGTFNIQTTEGEGIESKSVLTINDGIFNIQAYDDGLNAIQRLYINGGQIYVTSSNNDAIDANGPATITGGTIIGVGARGVEAGLDVDNNPIKITGGTLLGMGGSTSRNISQDSTQNTVIFAGVNANTLLHIQSSEGTEALTYRVPSTVNTILYSSPKLTTGKNYTLYSGGIVNNGTEVNGLYTAGSYSGESTLLQTFVVSDKLTQIGGQTGPGGGGGFGRPGARN